MILITGSAGLIGSSCSDLFMSKKFEILGIDNNFRKKFFGKDGDTSHKITELKKYKFYKHLDVDISSYDELKKIFKRYSKNIDLIIHCAAQPSHDYAKNQLYLDNKVNLLGTLNLLDLYSKYCPNSKFIFLSTNKVYGDLINSEEFIENEKRYNPKKTNYKKYGIGEFYPIDQSTHSYFGCSKLAADIYVQEFGRNNKLDTTILRGGCLTGPAHQGAQLHGFLSFLVKSHIQNKKYIIFGHKGKQVRDNIHSYDMANLIYQIFKGKKNYGEVFNVGGGIYNNCSVLEAIQILERISKKSFDYSISKKNRTGDHMWWISDLRKIESYYPSWSQTFNLEDTIKDIYDFETKKE